MGDRNLFASDHASLTRRYFLRVSGAALAALGSAALWADEVSKDIAADPALGELIGQLEYLTPLKKFHMLGRGNPPPYQLPPEKLREVGLAPETWKLEIVPDPESNSELAAPMSKAAGTALDWAALMKLSEKHAVRFLHVMTCTNAPQPFGMGLWEGVPLRDVFWPAKPGKNIRRIFYYGYHNDDPKQRFQSSLPVSRVLEEAPGELPVILCYRLNGQWLSPAAGGPVRLVTPGAYGNKSVKWLQRIEVTNSFQANDTYAGMNNDVESPLKSFARFIHAPQTAKAGRPIPLTGLAQAGLNSVSKVQYWLRPAGEPLPADDPYLARGDWRDAVILPPPAKWGSDLPDGKLPPVPLQMDPATGRPRVWPIPNTIAHWVALLKGVAPGRYELRCRAVDLNGIAQPLPRPFGRSGVNAIQMVALTVEG